MSLTTVDQGLLGQYAQYTGFKNRIINGQMQIDQRNAGASLGSGVSTFWPVDRFQYNSSIASKINGQQTPSATETGYATRVAAGFSSYLAFTSASAYPLGAGDYFFFRQRIEGTNCSDLAWGTSSAKTVTLSFWVNASLTGTYSVMITNNGQARTYVATYTVNSANTWEQKTITIAGDQSGTWLTTSGVGVDVNFCLGVGATYATSTLNTWSSSFYIGASSQVNVAGTNGATFYITGVQLEKGSTATSFDYRPYGTELQLCERYYRIVDYNGAPLALYVNTANAYGGISFSQMRSAPGVSFDTTFANSGVVHYTDGSSLTSIACTYGTNAAASTTSVSFYAARSGNWPSTTYGAHTYVRFRLTSEL